MTPVMGERAVMYTAGMAGPPDVPDEMKIFEARNSFAAVIDKARYFGGVTFLMNRGKRVAAVTPVEIGELLTEVGGPQELIDLVRAGQAARRKG